MSKEFGELEDDPEFQEYLKVRQSKSKSKTWSDEMLGGQKKSKEIEPTRTERTKPEPARPEKEKKRKSKKEKGRKKLVEVEEGEEGEEGGMEEEGGGEVEGTEDKSEGVAMSLHTSDLDYLRTKVVKEQDSHRLPEECVSDSEGGEEEGEEGGEESEEGEEGSEGGEESEEGGESEEGEESEEGGESSEGEDEDLLSLPTTPYTIKMLGLPFRAAEKDVHAFFHPLTVAAVRFTKDAVGRPSGRAYADFLSEADVKKALKRNKDCIFHRYIELFRDTLSERTKAGGGAREGGGGEKLKPWELKTATEGAEDEEGITESGRIFVRNLPYSTQEEELNQLFGEYGPLTEVTIPVDKTSNKSMGLAFVTFMLPEHAAKAYQELDGQIFQGRLLHLLPAKARRGKGEEPANSFKKKKELKMKSEAGKGHNWNTLFLGANAVVDVMAGKYSAEKSDILDPAGPGTSAAVRLALGETEIVSETREFLQSHGVNLEVFEQSKPKRSKTVILVKNLAAGTTVPEMSRLFQAYGQLMRVILPPAGISALVEFVEPSHAKQAFSKLAYTSFKHLPLFLEWAPVGVLSDHAPKTTPLVEQDAEEGEGQGDSVSVFVKNLNFTTTEESLTKLFSRVGEVVSVSIARKKNTKDPATPLSMGFGFVEFASENLAREAIKQLQHSELEGHTLQLKISNHKKHDSTSQRAKPAKKQKSAKILVRNIPFEAARREIKELFGTFGALKTVRLPKKASVGSGDHRGFGFVEFTTKEDAKRAFEALGHSTHLYGRRLILEWAEQEESLDAVRKRTAEHFHGFKTKRTKVTEQMVADS